MLRSTVQPTFPHKISTPLLNKIQPLLLFTFLAKVYIYLKQTHIFMSTLTRERKSEYQDQLWRAAFTGLAKGLLVGLVTGFYINYKFNWGVNTKFFRTPYRFWYLMSWTIAGLAFDTDIAKHKISKQMAIEREIRRTVKLNQEMYGSDLEIPK